MLCYGWIDGQKKAYDEHSWIQKFSPRRAQSGWSKINTERAESVGEEQKGEGVFRYAKQSKRLFHRLSAPNGEVAGNPRKTHAHDFGDDESR
jgi:uncharacterized protein YdeI (YjbR/CyaY-like superfamily)